MCASMRPGRSVVLPRSMTRTRLRDGRRRCRRRGCGRLRRGFRRAGAEYRCRPEEGGLRGERWVLAQVPAAGRRHGRGREEMLRRESAQRGRASRDETDWISAWLRLCRIRFWLSMAEVARVHGAIERIPLKQILRSGGSQGLRSWFPRSQNRDLGHPEFVVELKSRDVGHPPPAEAKV